MLLNPSASSVRRSGQARRKTTHERHRMTFSGKVPAPWSAHRVPAVCQQRIGGCPWQGHAESAQPRVFQQGSNCGLEYRVSNDWSRAAAEISSEILSVARESSAPATRIRSSASRRNRFWASSCVSACRTFRIMLLDK